MMEELMTEHRRAAQAPWRTKNVSNFLSYSQFDLLL